MGKMKHLGQQLTADLEELYVAQLKNTILQGGKYGGGVLGPAPKSTTISNSGMRMSMDDPNKREAYSIPLSTLVNAWRVKFGDLWVDVSEIDEEFWSDASSRLHRNKLMEEVEFRESNTPWARLREDA
jgi:hypothetical protein